MPSLLSRASGWLGRVFRNASAFFRPRKLPPIPKIEEVVAEEGKELKEYDGVVYFIYEETAKKHHGRKTELEINFAVSLDKNITSDKALEEIRQSAVEWASEREGYGWIKSAARKSKINVGTTKESFTDTQVSDYVLKRIARETPQ